MLAAAIIAFFGSCVAAALCLCWCDRDLRMAGCALAISFIVSNLAHAFAPQSSLPAIYTVVEVLVAVLAFGAWIALGFKSLVRVVLASVASCCANLAMAACHSPSTAQLNIWEAMTNACFLAECIFLGCAGWGHAQLPFVDHLWGRLADRWRDPQLDGLRKSEKEPR